MPHLKRWGMTLVANALIVIGLVGVATTQSSSIEGLSIELGRLGVPGLSSGTPTAIASADLEGESDAFAPAEEAPAAVFRAATAMRIPSIRLESEVVAAPVAQLPQGLTWDVPPFKVGHAEGTASPGQRGNVVLLGHVTSLTLGNVFIQLERVRPGDLIYLSDGESEFTYYVDEVTRVPRDDIRVIRPTVGATTTLVTCIGEWLPVEHDYAERLVVRARLI
jgi:LPXTG-site transpeptidase (sortase) family protein